MWWWGCRGGIGVVVLVVAVSGVSRSKGRCKRGEGFGSQGRRRLYVGGRGKLCRSVVDVKGWTI